MTSATNSAPTAGVGGLLRTWRARRRMSQLDLSSLADVSTRHLSYVETGRSSPSRELVLHLARHLDVPLREQNDLLIAAGYAPAFSRLDLDDPAMRPVVTALQTMLAGSEPNPTLVMDRHWNLVMANEAALAMTAGVATHLLEPQLNVIELTLHPDGLAPRITNLDEVAAHLIHRIRRQHAVTGDPALAELATTAEQLVPNATAIHPITAQPALTVHMRHGRVDTTLLSMVSTFGTALDVTAAELTIETFYDVTEG
jgi:transcriptional regulator with XRE-family HTH domain